MAARDNAPLLIRFFSFWGKLALFFGILMLFMGPGMLPLHRMPGDLHWLGNGGNLISIGIFLLVPTLFYRIAMAVKRRIDPEAIVDQLRSLQDLQRTGGQPSGGWREQPVQTRRQHQPVAHARQDANAPLQRNKPLEPAVRGRRARTPLIRR